jgi:anti-anti-sigma factor
MRAELVDMQIDIGPNQSVIVHPSGRLDATSANFVQRRLVAVTRTGFYRWLILDLTQVPSLNSAGLQVVLICAQAARGMGSELRLVCVDKQLRVLLDLTCKTDHIRWFDTVEAAIAGNLPSRATAMRATGGTNALA